MIVDHGNMAGSDVLLLPVPVHGVRIDVVELSRTVRVRNRGGLTLLDSASFTVAAGELVAIVGPSGAGKTTLLEAIAGFGPVDLGVGALRRHRRAREPGGRSAACSATCRRTTSSTPICRSGARSGTPRGCGSRRRRPRPRSTAAVE